MSESLLCPCGSGLRRVSCCGPRPAAARPPPAPHLLAPLADRAAQALGQGNLPAAARAAINLLELAPDHTAALAVLARVRSATGPATAAEALLRRLVALDPADVWALGELAALLLARQHPDAAEPFARSAVRLAPDQPLSHSLMGIVLTEQEKPRAGEYHYLQVLKWSATRDPALLANLALNLKKQGRIEESRALYREADAAGPPVPQTLLGWARLEEADRNFDAALDLLDRAEALAPDSAHVLLERAITLGRIGRHEAALALFDRIAALGPDDRLEPHVLLERGRLLDRMGRFDDAWAAFVEGKRRARETAGYAYRAKDARRQADRIRAFFVADRLRALPRGSPREGVAQPLFIVGFPRSGTTLVEQTLASHPRIAAGGELSTIHEIVDQMPRLLDSPLTYPDTLSELLVGDRRDGLDILSDFYFRRAAQLGALPGVEKRFTDKMPLNETHLGLVSLIFPTAPIVHVLRHPLDVVLSAFANWIPRAFHGAFALDSLAQHLVLTHDLVAHYRAEMELRYLPLRYEDIVERQEPSVRTLLAFVGEEFHPDCLDFHENRRIARTASYAQVTEKLYSSSRFRYRDYLPHLEPVLPTLAPLIERLGYGV